MTIGQAVAAAAARPNVFHPYIRTNINGQEQALIDGGMAATNPTLYAYEMARHLYGFEKIRIMSLGSTHPQFMMFAPDAFSDDSKYLDHGAITKQMMAYTADYFLAYNNFYPCTQEVVDGVSVCSGEYAFSGDYLRVDGTDKTEDIGSDASKDTIKALQSTAADVWTAN